MGHLYFVFFFAEDEDFSILLTALEGLFIFGVINVG